MSRNYRDTIEYEFTAPVCGIIEQNRPLEYWVIQNNLIYDWDSLLEDVGFDVYSNTCQPLADMTEEEIKSCVNIPTETLEYVKVRDDVIYYKVTLLINVEKLLKKIGLD